MTVKNNEAAANKQKWTHTTGGVIFWLFIFFPVGAYLMWRYAKWNNITKGIITAILAFLFLRGFTTQEGKEAFKKGMEESHPTVSEATPTPSTDTQAQPQEQAASQESTQDKIMASIQKTLGKDYRSVEIIETVNNGYTIMVTYSLLENLTSKMTLSGNYAIVAKTIKALIDAGYQIDQAVFSGYTNVIDKYGNESDGLAFRYKLTVDEMSKINWQQDEATLAYQIIPAVGTVDVNILEK